MTSARAFGLTVTKMSGGQELVLCPFHNDRHASAWWNPTKELFYCAVCGLGLNAVQLANRLGLEHEEVVEWDVEPEDFNLVDESEPWNLGVNEYHEYFKQRGICPTVIDRCGIRWKYTEPEAAVIPLCDINDNVQGVQYRYLDVEKAGTRYKTFGKVPPVWPMQRLPKLHEGQMVMVVEGAWSALRLETFSTENEHSYPPAFALLGAKANEEIVEVLRPFQAVYLYDNDDAGRRACRKMRELSPLSWSFVGNSPDDMNDAEILNMYGALKLKLTKELTSGLCKV